MDVTAMSRIADERHYNDVVGTVDHLIEILEKRGVIDTADYVRYSDTISGIYRDLSGRELLKIFSIHTLIQMYVNVLTSMALGRVSNPVEMCLGDTIHEYMISIPNLIWWRDLAVERRDKEILAICSNALSYAYRLDRDDLLERDPISRFYEDLISSIARYNAGEYYTPRWVIELMLNRLENLGADLASETFADPSCGSGRFLTSMLNKRISEKVEDIEAYHRILGLDINPLAVALARARLVIAYKLLTGRDPPGPPAVFWGDFVGFSLGREGYSEVFGEPYTDFIDLVSRYGAKMLKNRKSTDDLLRFIIYINSFVYDLLEVLRRGGSSHSSSISCRSAYRSIDQIAAESLNKIYRSLSTRLRENLTDLVSKHGSGMTSLIISSYIIGKLLRNTRFSSLGVVATNPPWLEINELPKNLWGRLVKRYIELEYVRGSMLPKQAVSKGDLSAVFLDLALRSVKDRGYVGMVLPAEQSYSGGETSHGAGKLLTYSVLERWRCRGEILYLGDAFDHGVHASIVVARKGEDS